MVQKRHVDGELVRRDRSRAFFAVFFRCLIFTLIFSIGANVSAAPAFTYHGRLMTPSGAPVTSANVQFKVQIRSPGIENCLLYEETFSRDMTGTNGVFSLQLNAGIGIRTDSSGYSFEQIFSNRTTLTLPVGQCAVGTTFDPRTPVLQENRKVQLHFNDGSFAPGTFEALPAQALNYVPGAVESKQVGGYPATQLLRVADGVSQTQTELSNAAWTELLALINGTSTTYVRPGSATFTAAPTWSGTPSNASDLVNKSYVDALTIAAGLPDVGTPGTYTKVYTDSKGRVTLGGTLTESDIPTLSTAGKVSGDAITSGTIGGSTAITTSGAISTSGGVTAGTLNASATSTNTLRIYNGANYVQMQAPALGGNVNFTLPASDGSGGQVLTTNGSGQLGWGTLTLSDFSGVLPVSKGGTGSSTALLNNRLMVSSGGNIVEGAAITSGRALVSDGSGLPSASAVTATELGYLGGVTAAIQTQIDNKQPALNFVPVNRAGDSMTGGLTLSGDPTVNLGAATKQYVDGAVSGAASNYVRRDGSVTLTANWDVGGWRLNNLGGPTAASDAATKQYVDSAVSTLGAGNYVAIAGDTMTGALSLPTNGLNVGSNQLVVSGGNVGIGASAPGYTLDVQSTGQRAGNFQNTGTSGAQYGIWASATGASTTNVGASFQASGGSTANYGAVITVPSGTNNYAIFANGTAQSYLGGNLGVGTAAPGERLDVAGAIKIGDATGTADGTIRWTGTDFEGRKGGSWVSLTYLGSGASGETNTASNQGVGGVGVFDSKSGVDLQFRNINAASARISITNDSANKEIDIDVNEGSLTLGNFAGVLPVGKGGTGSSTALVNNRLMISSGGNIIESPALTADRVLASDTNGLPTASAVTATELGYLGGVTAAIQTQLDSKQPALNFVPVNRAGDTMTGGLTLSGDPTANLGAATKQYVDGAVSGAASNYVRRDGSVTLTANWDVGGWRLNNLGAPTAAGDAANRQYVDTAVAAVSSATGNFVAKAGDTMTGTLTLPLNGLVAGTDQLVLTGGNVGIGTISPGEKLEVTGAIKIGSSAGTANGTIRWTGSDFEGRKGGAWVSMTGAGSGDFKSDGSVSMTGPFRASNGSTAAPSITFASDPDTGFYSNTGNSLAMTIGGVDAAFYSNTSFTFYRTLSVQAASGGRVDVSRSTNPTAVDQSLGQVTFGSGPLGSSAQIDALAAESWSAGNKGSYLTLSTTPTGSGTALERMRVASNGNVGIGTTNPTEKLEVNGGIRLGSTTGTNAGTIRWDGTNFSGYNGSAWIHFVPDPPAGSTCDTTVNYTVAGTYSYTVPATYGTIEIQVWGGGGGGGGSSNYGGGSTGGMGGTSSIASLGLTAFGGAGGGTYNSYPTTGYGVGGSGGTATGGTTNTNGSTGGTGSGGVSGAGAIAPLGGSGGNGVAVAGTGVSTPGQSGTAPGGGGSGGAWKGDPSAANAYGGGGGSGSYLSKTFTPATLAPGTTISSIIVGAGGTAGSGPSPGGVGGSGRIIITCASAGAPPINDRAIVFQNSGSYGADPSFVYTASGSVGIGTVSPGEKMEVAGAIKIGDATGTADGTIRWNGSDFEGRKSGAWVSLTGAGAVGGITSLGGLTTATQTFATLTSSGTAPDFVSAAGTHTLVIPLASAAGVTAGLISKSDYDSFAGKQASLGFTPVNLAGDTMLGGLTLSADPTANLGAATKQYVDSAVSTASTSYVRRDGTATLTANWDVGGWRLTNLGAPTASGDAATKQYVDTAVSTLSGGNTAISSITAATGANTIANANYLQNWNWSLSGATEDAFTIGETVAATGGGGDQSLLKVTTLPGSTAIPLVITNGGNGISFRVNHAGSDTDSNPFVIDASGHVGVGTTNPGTSVLNIRKTGGQNNRITQYSEDGGTLFRQEALGSGVTFSQFSSGTGWAKVADNATIAQFNTSAYDGAVERSATSIKSIVDGAAAAGSMPALLSFSTTPSGSVNPIERMRITSSGNVGIGATNPAALLDLESTSPGIRIKRNSNASDTLIRMIPNGTVDSNNPIYQFNMAGSGYNHFSLQVNDGSTSSNALLVTRTGSVGVGGTPISRFHVIGSSQGTALTYTRNADDSGLGINPYVTSAGDGYKRYVDMIAWGDSASGKSSTIRFFTQDASNQYAPRMIIDGSGNIGVGTISPGEKLEVEGGIKIGNASGTADGTIRWTGSDFEGRKGGTWVSMTGLGSGTVTGTGTTNKLTKFTAAGAIGDSIMTETNATTVSIGNLQLNANSGGGHSTISNTASDMSIASNLSSVSAKWGGQVYANTAHNVGFELFSSQNTIFDINSGGGSKWRFTTDYTLGGNLILSKVSGSNPAFVFDNSRVGIGVASPVATLDVAGENSATASAPLALRVVGGNSTFGGGNGGGILLQAGHSSGGATGGGVTIAGGYTTNFSNAARSSSIVLSGSTWDGIPGFLTMQAGRGVNARAGGAVSIIGGEATDLTATGGSVVVKGGIWSTASGGDVLITGGAKTGAGSDGNVILSETRGRVGIGTASPGEKLEVSGAIKIGNALGTTDGTIRWTGSDFEGRKGGTWVSMTSVGLGFTPVNLAGDTMLGGLTLSADPTANLGAATKQYVDGVISSAAANYVRRDGSLTLTANWDIGGWRLTNIGAPTTATDAATKQYVDNAISTLGGGGDYVARSGDAMTGALTLPANGLYVGSNQLVLSGGNVGIGVASPATPLHINGATSHVGVVPPGLSDAGQGRIYYDSTLNKFRVSQNGGTYVDLVATSGVTEFTALTDTPSSYIGAANQFVRVNPGGTGLIFSQNVVESISGQPAPDALDLADLSSVALSLPANGQCLTFNGTSWVNSDCLLAPAGNTSEIQYNSGGQIASSANFIWDNGNNRLVVTGDIHYSGALLNTSDRRLKENIKPLDQDQSTLEKLKSLVAYQYNFKADPKQKVRFGVMAQDLENIYPELVYEKKDGSGTKAVDYSGLIPVLMKAIQEQQKLIEAQQRQIDELREVGGR